MDPQAAHHIVQRELLQHDCARVSRFETARALRALRGMYGRNVLEHLATWPEDERDEERDALRRIVLGEDA